MQTCVILHAVAQLFACRGHHGSLKAPQVLGVGMSWL